MLVDIAFVSILFGGAICGVILFVEALREHRHARAVRARRDELRRRWAKTPGEKLDGIAPDVYQRFNGRAKPEAES